MRIQSRLIFGLGMFLILGMMAQALLAQGRPLTFPRVSPHATASQTVAFVDIDIDYHRPGVKGRNIWGELVPYGQVWRAGANENTTITLSHNVTINGQPLSSGVYGLHMIPNKNKWTIVFSKDNTAWGSFNYDENNDALRVTAVPVSAPHEEWLRYGFDEITPNSVTAYLQWEKLKVPFTIGIDRHEVVLENMRNELKSLPGFFDLGWRQIATYCLNNDTHLEDALGYADRAIGINKSAQNILVKAQVLQQMGREKEAMQFADQALALQKNFTTLRAKSKMLANAGDQKAADKLLKEALDIATENELNSYGYQLLGQNKVNEAIDIFKSNVQRNPDSWNVYDSLAEAYQRSGNKSASMKNYKVALQKAPENQRSRINGILTQLESE